MYLIRYFYNSIVEGDDMDEVYMHESFETIEEVITYITHKIKIGYCKNDISIYKLMPFDVEQIIKVKLKELE